MGLSQKKLADELGISPVRLYNWEHNRHSPSIDRVADICRILEVSPDDLLDIHLEQKKLTRKEKAVIQGYRNKDDFQKAVDKLLETE